jgi:uncharacterized protein with PIN domain
MNTRYPNNISPLIHNDFKFITDASLGRLAKWLRLWGYNTVVFPNQAGRAMLRLAVVQNRIVLTRRRDMVQRQFSGRLFLITGVDASAQLNDVIEKFFLQIDRKKMFGICLECNEKLYPVAREDVRDLVPPYVFESITEYNHCPRCHKIYWAGTHQRNALEFMKKHIPNHLPCL